MAKRITKVQIRPDSSTPGIVGAHIHLIERLAALAPQPLDPRHRANDDDLEERAALLENAFKAFEDFVLAFLSDTADHSWAVNIDRKYLTSCLYEARGEAVGTLTVAAETARQEAAWAA